MDCSVQPRIGAMFKTLVVDDNAIFRQSLTSVLTRLYPFMEIEEATSGAAALRHHWHHELVFMDIRLPDINGLELTRRFKVADPEARICVVTQFDLPEYRQAASQSGANGFMLKDALTEAAVVELVEAILAEPES
jgi:DNA-binding NarL/FixJ family response regulator